jgi:CubicO group peptidase (beta-lactamase class C family)
MGAEVKTVKHALIVSSVLLLVGCQQAAPAPPPPSIDTGGQAAIAEFLNAAVDRGDVPGVVALVVGPEQTLYHGAAGRMNVAGDVPMAADAIFRIASMTKAVTSVAVMMLVEDGRLGLDDEVSQYIPELTSPNVLVRYDSDAGTYETRPATRPITIRQLLTHTSGIGYSWSDPGLALVQQKTGQASERELPLVHEPGEKWTYGASTKVLGDVVETISGQRIDHFLQERVFGPLGMTDTFFEVPREKYARVVTQHQKTGETKTETPIPETIPTSLRADGGLLSTAADYGRFVQMILNRGRLGEVRILQEETVLDMGRTHTGDVRVRLQPTANPGLSHPYPLGADADTWGLGFQLAAPGAPDMRRAGSMSWAGIFNTFFWIDPEAQVGVVVLMQTLPFYDEEALGVLQGVERLVYRHLH